MAERVGQSAVGRDLARRARALPAPVWFVLLVAAALVVAVVVSIVGHTSNPLSAQVSAVTRQSDPLHFTFSYDVSKNPLATADCTFEVQDEDHVVVGRTTQRVGPTGTNERTTRHDVTVDTTRQGVTAVLDHCQLQRT